MKTLISLYHQTELFLGNMKFAVVIISLFAVALGFGTFMESYHGTDYANRLVYKSWWFMGIQLGMFLSILFATLLRLPLKKRLYGFYTIHLGLILLFIGSFVTYYAGVDGTLTLYPNTPSREIQVNEDELKIQFPGEGKEVTFSLPYSATPTNLNYKYKNLTVKTFLPFAEGKHQWVSSKIDDPFQSSTSYRIFNDNVSQDLTLSLHPLSDFQNTTKLGPLNIHYMPQGLGDCFSAQTQEGLILWSAETNNCIAPTQSDITKTKSLTGKNFLQITFEGVTLHFLPDLSPFPLNENAQINEKSPFRIFSKKLFEKSPHLFLFGEDAVFYLKDEKIWKKISLKKNQELPWMGFHLEVLRHDSKHYPIIVPSYVKPIQDNGKTIRGDMKAVEVSFQGQNFWVTSKDPIAFRRNDEKVVFELNKKVLTLPYEIVLDRFKMDTDPGTNNPASYESFVTLFKGNEGSSQHHVYMNHPLKNQNFTFYQASYFQTSQGPYGSVFSVNFDPGRFLKYLGSLLLVLGSIWHFVLRKKTSSSQIKAPLPTGKQLLQQGH